MPGNAEVPLDMMKSRSWRWVVCLLVIVLGAACTPSEKRTIRVAIGTQNATINCATGGLLLRELSLLERFLPREGAYKDVEYEIVWKDFSSGPPITGEMIAGHLDFGMMADFPAVMNGVASQQAGKRNVYIAALSGSAAGAGNGILVPIGSPVHTMADLRGKRISVAFGSTAHGMLLRALSDLGMDPERDVTLVSQQPAEAEAALRWSTIDAHAGFVPFAELFPFRGIARKIYDGAITQIPTSHGMLVRAAYAEEHPEVVVGLLRAVIEADRLLEQDPERYSEVIEQVTGVDAEVAYMFHGPLGIQTRDVALKPQFVHGLRVAADTLVLLRRADDHLDIDHFVDDRYVRQAFEAAGVSYEERIARTAKVPITGADALTGAPIADPKRAAQIWVEGETWVRPYGSPASALAARRKLGAEGRQVRAMFVHDRHTGLKLLAEQAWYAEPPDGDLAAFLSRDYAETWARERKGAVKQLAELKAEPAPAPQPPPR
ncbi:nitrate ABC transporter substrate-binding protein [Sorangium cellulosum]|uniref:Putative aliphatic sulfonates-binding protein n=2 Tax=Sorangium cellulosum TaxID=56 RepID=A0A2L0ETU3_SORCE|nr:nitrate ABC transporter substrate-binding protein [Sorangium cellulosum]